MNKTDLVKMLVVTGEMMGRELSADAVSMMVDDLSDYPVENVAAALKRVRTEGARFNVGEIVSRLPGDWPGADEAWAMAPKSEDDTACVCSEILNSMDMAQDCLGDLVAMRMAFKSAYIRTVAEARYEGRRPIWSISPGHDTNKQQAVIEKAIRNRFISKAQALPYLPELSELDMKRIEGGGSAKPQLTAIGQKSITDLVERLRMPEKKKAKQ